MCPQAKEARQADSPFYFCAHSFPPKTILVICAGFAGEMRPFADEVFAFTE